MLVVCHGLHHHQGPGTHWLRMDTLSCLACSRAFPACGLKRECCVDVVVVHHGDAPSKSPCLVVDLPLLAHPQRTRDPFQTSKHNRLPPPEVLFSSLFITKKGGVNVQKVWIDFTILRFQRFLVLSFQPSRPIFVLQSRK